MKKTFIILLIFIGFSRNGICQKLSFQFFPEIDGRNLQGIFNVKLINGGNVEYGSITITVNAEKRGKICIINLPGFNISKGLSSIPPDVVKRAKYQFSNSQEGRLLAKAGIFVSGELSYCFEFDPINSNGGDIPGQIPPQSVENCFDYSLIPLSQLSLTSPYDGEKMCNVKPVFTWLPSLPIINSSQFKIICAEIKEDQSSVEALKYNLAFINTSGLQAPVYPFPANVRELGEGKKYAWQVIQYSGDVIINKSEVWEFEIGCDEEGRKGEEKNVAENGYRVLDDLSFGKSYHAKGDIRILVNNPYQEQTLKYELNSLDGINHTIKGLPEIKLLNGTNKIVIPLKNLKGLKSGETYILKLWLPDGTTKNLRIEYNN